MSPRGTTFPPGCHPSWRRGFDIVLVLLARDAQRAQLRPRENVPEGPRLLDQERSRKPERNVLFEELDRVRVSIERGQPYGEEKWVRETVKDLGLEQTVRPEGRPRKASQSATEATS